MAAQRRTVRYSGRVQGVGFRAATRRIAAAYAVTGYVQNLPDGSVRMVAEGPSDELDAFQTAIRKQMADRIAAEFSDPQPPLGDFDDFSIRY
ncbi:Acylphosphatase [Pirellulimonas nuda]|uniref:acylphosphatase n=1 Tax=Pirellulimonas nuda TaxID=2528009 RepID=A0A518DFB5_9BACT|nr:acylphosphatase [Pirellulimonas nuda]QDU90160.1 Acylphosphatase [Pirellulimonas nuda]